MDAQIVVTEKGIKVETQVETAQRTLKNYEEIATRIGISHEPTRITREIIKADEIASRLSTFFIKNKIELYDYTTVDRWLEKKAGPGRTWIWWPLRNIETQLFGNKTLLFHHFSSWDDPTPYDKPIPIETLRKVEQIIDNFGRDVMFFVSEVTRILDPFIMVMPAITSKDSFDEKNIFIFDMWDEPGFKK